MPKPQSILTSLVAVAIVLPTMAAPAAPLHCDASLAPSSNNPYRYTQRGDRCEGVYIQAVGGTTLALLSFTASLAEFDPQAGRPLLLEWSAPPGHRDVQVRAQSMRQIQRRLFYRMDTLVAKGGTRYLWPTDGLAAVKLARADVGLIAFARMPVGGVEEDVLLPLSVGPGVASNSAGYALLLRPAEGLNEVYVSVAPLGPDGNGPRVFGPGRELGYGIYPADALIEVPVSPPRERGFYAVQIGAQLRRGGSTTLQFVFHHAGP